MNGLAIAVRALVAIVNGSIGVRLDLLVIVDVDVRFD